MPLCQHINSGCHLPRPHQTACLTSFPLSQTTILSKKKPCKLWCCMAMSLSERLACRQAKPRNGAVSQEFALVRMLAQSTLKTKLLSSTRHAMSVFHKRKKCRLQSSTGSNFSMRQMEQTIDRLTSCLGDTNKKPV